VIQTEEIDNDAKTKEREFICEIPFGCGNYLQYSLKESRKCVSDFFGRNKTCTKLIAQPIIWCRAHYQQKGYHKRTWRFERLQLVSEQFRRIEKQEPSILYTLVPIRGESERIISIVEKDKDIPPKEATHGRGQHYRAPRWALMRIYNRFVGENFTMEDCIEFLTWAEKHMKLGHLQQIPQIEFLPQFQACFTSNKKGLGMCAPQKKLLTRRQEAEAKGTTEDIDSDAEDIPLDGEFDDYDEELEYDDEDATLDGNRANYTPDDTPKDSPSYTPHDTPTHSTSGTPSAVNNNRHDNPLDLEELNTRLFALAQAGFTPINGRASAAKEKMHRSRVLSRTMKTYSSPESNNLPHKSSRSASVNSPRKSGNLPLGKPRPIAKPRQKKISPSELVNPPVRFPLNNSSNRDLKEEDLDVINNYARMSLDVVHSPGLEEDGEAAYLRGILQTLTFAIDSIKGKKGFKTRSGQ
jgi:hypothetical protein